MNLEESNSYQQKIESVDRKKRAVMLSIILCGVFIALLFILIIMISYKDSVTEKFFINGQQQKNMNSSIYGELNGVTYLDVKALSELLGYTYTKGEYKKYNENEDSCYLQNDFETVAITAGEDNYDKYINVSTKALLADIAVTSKNKPGYSENYKIENPIIFENGKIYAPLEAIPKMFNITIDWQQYRKKIFTLENRIKKAQATIAKNNYVEMSGYYENLRAVIDGYVVVGDAQEVTSKSSSQYYGVFSLKDNAEVISIKYDDITYVQNAEEFYITVENGTMGLLNAEGGTIIAPSEFEEISLLDQKNELYLVKKGEEYGVVNRNGKILVYAENDKIGLDEEFVSQFELEPLENPYMLFDNCIPAEKEGKYGLYNSKGELVLNINYEGFGYKSTATSKTSGNEQSVLIIPESVGVKGIVINKEDLYGIFDTTTEKIIMPCVYNKIYAITRNGKTTYYAEWNGTVIDLKDELNARGFNAPAENDENNTVETSNEAENDIDNTEETPNTEQPNENEVVYVETN